MTTTKTNHLIQGLAKCNPLIARLKHLGLTLELEPDYKDDGTPKPSHENLSFSEYSGTPSNGQFQVPAASDVISAAQFHTARYATPIAFSSRDREVNASPEQWNDLVEARTLFAQATMVTLLRRHLCLDGTGNDGKNITGLAAMLSPCSSSGVYGAIDRSFNLFWRHKVVSRQDIEIEDEQAALKEGWKPLLKMLTHGTDKPDLILCGEDMFERYKNSLAEQDRKAADFYSSRGFTSLTFEDIPVVLEPLMRPDAAYFLNTGYLRFRYNETRMPDNSSNAEVDCLVFEGNLTASSLALQGAYFG